MICASPIIPIKLVGLFLMTPKYGNARYTNGDDQPMSGAWFTLLAIHLMCEKPPFLDHKFPAKHFGISTSMMVYPRVVPVFDHQNLQCPCFTPDLHIS